MRRRLHIHQDYQRFHETLVLRFLLKEQVLTVEPKSKDKDQDFYSIKEHELHYRGKFHRGLNDE